MDLEFVKGLYPEYQSVRMIFNTFNVELDKAPFREQLEVRKYKR